MADTPVLETRVCKCGCGKTFRSLPNSKSEYYSEYHSPNANNIEDNLRNKRPQRRPQDMFEEFIKGIDDYDDEN